MIETTAQFLSFLFDSATSAYLANSLGIFYGVWVVGVVLGLTIQFCVNVYEFFKRT